MQSKEFKVNLAELEHTIDIMGELKKQAEEVIVLRKIYEDFFIHNKGKTKEKMNACEYKATAIKNRMLLLIEKTSIFLQNAKVSIEEDNDYIARKIDTLTK